MYQRMTDEEEKNDRSVHQGSTQELSRVPLLIIIFIDYVQYDK